MKLQHNMIISHLFITPLPFNVALKYCKTFKNSDTLTLKGANCF